MDGSRLFITPTMALILSVFRRKPSVVSSMPRVRFSSTVSWSTTFSSWNRVLIPFCFASLVVSGIVLLPVQEDPAARPDERPGEDLDEGGFPRAVLPHQAVDGVPLDVEADVVHRPHAGEILHEVPDLQDVVCQSPWITLPVERREEARRPLPRRISPT